MAATSFIFFHSGMVSKLSLLLSAFIAFNISITTRILREMVDADLDMSLANISQPISGNSLEHRWKWLSWEKVI